MNRLMRSVAVAMIALATVVVLDGCGRKEKLTPPAGADYPRKYPHE